MNQEKKLIIQAIDVMQKKICVYRRHGDNKRNCRQNAVRKSFCLLVNKRHPDDAWGILVVQDFIKGVIIPGRSSADVNVYEIITKPVITEPIDKDGRYVARLLCRAGIIRGPVEENRKIVGILEIASLILENELF